MPTATKSRTKSRPPARPVSKLAKRLVSPDLVCPHHWAGPDWVMTEGPMVAELNASAGFAPDPQQELALDMIFAVGANGLPASFAFCVICCRQNLKTGLFKQAAIGWLYVTDERNVVWSAHEMGTTLDAQRELGELMLSAPRSSAADAQAEEPRDLHRQRPGAHRAGHRPADPLQGPDQRRRPRALRRQGHPRRGLRAQAGPRRLADPDHDGPARRPGALRILGRQGRLDGALRRSRPRPRQGQPAALVRRVAGRQASPAPIRTARIRRTRSSAAWSVHSTTRRSGAKPTRRITTGRISLQTIADMRQELPPEEFMRECLGWWDEADAGAGAPSAPAAGKPARDRPTDARAPRRDRRGRLGRPDVRVHRRRGLGRGAFGPE
jgi:hypothetical protein